MTYATFASSIAQAPEWVSPVQGAPPDLRAEPSRRAVPMIGATVGTSIYIYISTNYFVAWVEVSETPRPPAPLGGHSRGNRPFSAGNRNTIEDPTSKAAKVTCFTVWIEARNSGNRNTIGDLTAKVPKVT